MKYPKQINIEIPCLQEIGNRFYQEVKKLEKIPLRLKATRQNRPGIEYNVSVGYEKNIEGRKEKFIKISLILNRT